MKRFKKPAKNMLKIATVLSPTFIPLPVHASISDTRELTSSQSSMSTITTTVGFGSVCYLIKKSNDKEDREEKKRVKKEIESFKSLKAEFMNVTAEVESDDSFMEGLMKAKKNVTLDADENSDDEEGEGGSGGDDVPKIPEGPSGGGGSEVKMADDEAVERMKKMFGGETSSGGEESSAPRKKRVSRFDKPKGEEDEDDTKARFEKPKSDDDDGENDGSDEGTKDKGPGARSSESATGVLDRPDGGDGGGGEGDDMRRVIKKKPKGERDKPPQLASESDIERLKRMMGGN
ncbi:hypothetical protein TL16_g07711 [Triparma laevis f. inornata]|uniref:Uncharacterized protein n=2 Tax=Triparma laevis TaxID=1534972 RepID=A0A9W7KX35_9STRA|nr:hypothetical protein TL16_g07711 [Triparma laevis f. inornata]GMI14957.1 hypothetical protein TrLO_g10416 [Triparma laevis f. longispina]